MHNLAYDILNVLKPFALVVVSGVVLTGVRSVGLGLKEAFPRVLLVSGVVALCVGVFFLNIEGGQILSLMKERPLWGIETVVAVGVLAASGLLEWRRRRAISAETTKGLFEIRESTDADMRSPIRYLAISGVALFSVSLVWLVVMAKSNSAL